MSLMRREVVSEPFIPESRNKKVPEKQKFSFLQDKHQEGEMKRAKSHSKNLEELQSRVAGQIVTGLKAMVSLGCFLKVLPEFGMTKV